MNDLIYCYPDSNILMNKIGIRDGELLEIAERRLTMLRIMELLEEPMKGCFDFVHLCSIHRYIFQDLYVWAGELRQVDIAKGTMFCKAEFLSQEADRIFEGLRENVLECRPDCLEFARSLAYYFSEINALHPFREGNGRVQREFIRELAIYHGYQVSFIGVTEEEMLEASKASFLCDYSPMERLFQRCISKKDKEPAF